MYLNVQSILEIFSPIKKILEYFLKTRKNILTEEEFSYPLCNKIWLELRTSQNKDNFLIARKVFLPSKNISYFKIEIVILRVFLKSR